MTQSDNIKEFLKYASPRLDYIENCMEKRALQQGLKAVTRAVRKAPTQLEAGLKRHGLPQITPKGGLRSSYEAAWNRYPVEAAQQLSPEQLRVLSAQMNNSPQLQSAIAGLRSRRNAATTAGGNNVINFGGTDPVRVSAGDDFFKVNPKTSKPVHNFNDNPAATYGSAPEGFGVSVPDINHYGFLHPNFPPTMPKPTFSLSRGSTTMNYAGADVPKVSLSAGDDVFKVNPNATKAPHNFDNGPVNVNFGGADPVRVSAGDDVFKVNPKTKKPVHNFDNGPVNVDFGGVDPVRVSAGDDIFRVNKPKIYNFDDGPVNVDFGGVDPVRLSAGDDIFKLNGKGKANASGKGGSNASGNADDIDDAAVAGNWFSRHPYWTAGAAAAGGLGAGSLIGYNSGNSTGRSEAAQALQQYYGMRESLQREALREANSSPLSRLANLFGTGELSNLIG
jgi:hypothetical protein